MRRLLTTANEVKLSHGLAEGEEGESEDFKGKRKKYDLDRVVHSAERNDEPKVAGLASVGSVGRFGACTAPREVKVEISGAWAVGFLNSAITIPYSSQKGSVGNHVGFRFLSGFLYSSHQFSHFPDMAFSSFRGGMRGERRWGCGWLAAAKMLCILPATTPPSPCYLTPWYVRSPAFSTSVSNKEAQSTSPLLLPKYPPVDCAAMTEKYVHIPLTFIFL